MRLLLALGVAFFVANTWAKEIVVIAWVAGPGDSVANISRSLTDEANKIQNKYTFIFESKPGAGGAVAANYVKNTPNTILATSAAFFIRPNFYPNESYDFASFQQLMPQCATPMVVTSKKYRSWKEVPVNAKLNFGINPGLGSTTHLAAEVLVWPFQHAQVVPFKSTTDSFVAMVSGHTDFDVGFLSTVNNWNENKSKEPVSILGITGSNSYGSKYPLLVNQGFPKTIGDMYLPFNLIVSSQTPKEKYNDWRTILVQAAKAKPVRDAYAVNYCDPMDQMPTSEVQPWFNTQIVKWRKFSTGIQINK